MAHVYGHCDFFKNNVYFAHTNRKMMDEMANHGTRVRALRRASYGEDEVEDFIDRCLSLENLIDIHSPFIRRDDAGRRYDVEERAEDDERGRRASRAKDYMDDYINPPEFLEAQRKKIEDETAEAASSFPEQPEQRRAAVPDRARAARALAARRPRRSSATRPTTSRRRGRRRS